MVIRAWPHLVVSDQALFGAVLQRPRPHAEGDALQGVVHGLLIDERAFTAGREDGRLVDQVGEIRSGKPRRPPRPEFHGDFIAQGSTAGMDAKDGFAAAAIRKLHHDLAVKATWTQQGRIQDIGPIGGRQHDDSGVLFEPVHFREQLVERLFALVVATTDASPALAANGIDLVDENDAGGLGLGLAEQIAHAAGTHPHETSRQIPRPTG